MRCPACNHDNRADRRFCTECGAPLSVVCPSCRAPVEAGEKFCGGCGARLPTVVPAPGAPTPTREPDAASPAGERRQLTVVFCDLVGSTALSQQLDPEEWRDVVGLYQTAARAAVERWGGHVAKELGDGLLVYFGWPDAREDDPERAIRAGLAILDAMEPVNALSAGDGTPLSRKVSFTGSVASASTDRSSALLHAAWVRPFEEGTGRENGQPPEAGRTRCSFGQIEEVPVSGDEDRRARGSAALEHHVILTRWWRYAPAGMGPHERRRRPPAGTAINAPMADYRVDRRRRRWVSLASR
jgi:hypothetical protein